MFYSSNFAEIDISKFVGNLKVTGMFLDPLGYHILINATPKQGDSSPAELLYLNRKYTKLKSVSSIFQFYLYHFLVFKNNAF